MLVLLHDWNFLRFLWNFELNCLRRLTWIWCMFQFWPGRCHWCFLQLDSHNVWCTFEVCGLPPTLYQFQWRCRDHQPQQQSLQHLDMRRSNEPRLESSFGWLKLIKLVLKLQNIRNGSLTDDTTTKNVLSLGIVQTNMRDELIHASLSTSNDFVLNIPTAVAVSVSWSNSSERAFEVSVICPCRLEINDHFVSNTLGTYCTWRALVVCIFHVHFTASWVAEVLVVAAVVLQVDGARHWDERVDRWNQSIATCAIRSQMIDTHWLASSSDCSFMITSTVLSSN